MTKLMISVLLAGIALPVGAQQGRPAGGPPPRDPARMQQMQQREGNDLALLLGLRANQRSALDAFLASGRPTPPSGEPGARPGSPPPASPGAMPTPLSFDQQLTRDEARLAEHVQAERAHIAAARTFYTGLDTRQKQLFDALMRLRHGPGGHGGPEGHDGPGERGPGGPGGHGPGGPGEGGPPPQG